MSNKKISIAPHFPGGLISATELQHIALIAERYGGALKLTGSNIIITGIEAAWRDKVLTELGLPLESFMSKAVRGVIMCNGKPSCPRGQQDSKSLGLQLDHTFFGQSVPAKIRIGVSGCANCCVEPLVKDIGLFGAPKGFVLAIGGKAGKQVQGGKVIALNLPADAVVQVVEDILNYYRQNGREQERLGDMVNRIGWQDIALTVVPAEYQAPALSSSK